MDTQDASAYVDGPWAGSLSCWLWTVNPEVLPSGKLVQVLLSGTERVTGDRIRLDGLRPCVPTPLPREWSAALLAWPPCCPRCRPAAGTAVDAKVADIVGCQATFSQLTGPVLLRL